MSALSAWPTAMMNNYGTPSVELIDGSGAWVRGADGTTYLDMLAGIAVNSLGHAHPKVVEAVSTQIAALGHTSNLFATQVTVQLATELIGRFGAEDARVLFCNSGAEANEAAFKIARLTGRRRVLAAAHGFHGRTMGALALTGQPEKQAPFQPLPGGVEFYPFGDAAALEKIVARNPSDVAAIFLEPIQGETGVIPAPEGFVRSVREICDSTGALMIVDEVQTGVGRTGAFFAFEHEAVLPDVVTMAKGLGGGLPIGAVIARGAAAQAFTPGSHGTTFGGNPVAAAAALAVLGVVDKHFVDEVAAKGEWLSSQLKEVAGVKEVRGRGLMLGIVLDDPVAKQVVQEGLTHGIILNAPAPDVVRVTPPLVISAKDLAEALQRFTLALVAALNKREETL